MKRYSTFNVDLSENVAYNDPAFPAYITSGFSGTSYFCETFHKYYKTTPLDFRKDSAQIFENFLKNLLC